ncbi:MAG: RNA polymerase sigma factor [bacterium]|nr:RNA polymerase sigma factor [bacterium]
MPTQSPPPMVVPSSRAESKPAPERAATSRTKIATPPRRKSRRNNTPWESDAELVEKILGGSRAHFDLLYEAYFPRVYGFAVKRLRDAGDAEDVTQEVFVTVYKALHTYAGTSSLLVWIFGITRNKVNRRFRGVRPRFESLDAPAAQDLATPSVPTDRAVDARRMLAHCEEVIETQLTPLQRRIFHLKHLRRQSIRSIAGSLGKSEDAVKANLYRMRRAIAQAAPGLEQILQA